MKKTLIKNEKEIFWNFVNSGLAGCLVFLGSLSSGEFSFQGLCLAIIAGAIVLITKFKEYWVSEEEEYRAKLFNFIN